MAVFNFSDLNPRIREMKTYYDPESGCRVYDDRQAFESCKQTYYLKIQTEQNKSNNVANNDKFIEIQSVDSKPRDVDSAKTGINIKEGDYLNFVYFFVGILLTLVIFILVRFFQKYGDRKK